MPTLLMLTYHFPPSAAVGSFRMLGFARHLPRFGWRTVVVAPPSLPWEPDDPALAARVPAETVVYPVPYPKRAPRVLRWMAQFSVWLPYARAAARQALREQTPDVVLTSSPPHEVHLLGRYLQRHYRLPWVADFRDPWVTSQYTYKGKGWRRRWDLFWERRVMRRADLIIHNAPAALADLQAAYPRAAERMVSLTNGYDPENFPAVSPHPPHQPVRLLHVGELYAGRDPRPLLDALAGIPAGTVRLEFVGRTEEAAGGNLMGEIRQRGLEDRVLCRGQVGYRESLEEMCGADLLLLLDAPGRRIGVPAKLYEYLGAGRPILAIGSAHGDLATILRDSGVPHRLAPPGDVARQREALLELVRGVTSGELGPGPEEARRRFSREALAGQLAGMMDRLLAAKRAGG